MAKYGKLLTRALVIGLLVAILVLLVRGRSSNYAGSPVVSVAGPEASAGPNSIFELKHDLKCVVGPSKDSAYYSQDMSPGGLCGDQEWIRAQMRDYSIDQGIGGSLLERS